MERISTNGETYVKGSAIARELGYTPDYVGQLCRGGKVDAQLVGRSWFVNEAEIRAHKQNRYRSTAAKSKAYVEKQLEESRQAKAPEAATDASEQNLRYESDEDELLPHITKANTSEVETSPEQESVTNAENEEKQWKNTPSEPLNSSAATDLQNAQSMVDERPFIRNSGQSVSVQTYTKIPTKRQPKTSVKKSSLKPKKNIPHQPAQKRVRPKRTGSPVVATMAVAVFAALGLTAFLGVEHHLIVSSGELGHTYSLNTATVFEAVEYVLK